jgi:hypothetical protein
MALAALGSTAEAEGAYQEALALAPEFADALLNLGNLRAGQGRLEEAVTLLERAAALNAGAPQAHYNLGCARFALGSLQGALDALRRAAALGADFAEVYYKTASVQVALGAVTEAIACYRQALERDSDHLGAQHGLLECLNTFPVGVDAARLESVVVPLLRAKSVNPRALGHAAARLLERKHRLDADDRSILSPEHLCDRLLDDEVVRLYLQRTINVSVSLERLLTRCRARWLARASEAVTLAQACRNFVGAVAIQCFLNDFAWAVTLEEESAADVLEQRIIDAYASAILAGEAPDQTLASDLLVYACYRPLWRIECAARLRAAPADVWPAALRDVMRVCLHEPLQECDSRPGIDSGTAIRGGVSRAVQAQYEESPYPRWLAITRAGVQDVAQRVQRWCPEDGAPAELGGPLRVLVAGCGTGIDAVERIFDSGSRTFSSLTAAMGPTMSSTAPAYCTICRIRLPGSSVWCSCSYRRGSSSWRSTAGWHAALCRKLVKSFVHPDSVLGNAISAHSDSRCWRKVRQVRC